MDEWINVFSANDTVNESESKRNVHFLHAWKLMVFAFTGPHSIVIPFFLFILPSNSKTCSTHVHWQWMTMKMTSFVYVSSWKYQWPICTHVWMLWYQNIWYYLCPIRSSLQLNITRNLLRFLQILGIFLEHKHLACVYVYDMEWHSIPSEQNSPLLTKIRHSAGKSESSLYNTHSRIA